jgi:hypothetical protein
MKHVGRPSLSTGPCSAASADSASCPAFRLLMEEAGVGVGPEVSEHMRQREALGNTVVLVAAGRRAGVGGCADAPTVGCRLSPAVVAALSIADPIKPEAAAVLAALAARRIQVCGRVSCIGFVCSGLLVWGFCVEGPRPAGLGVQCV